MNYKKVFLLLLIIVSTFIYLHAYIQKQVFADTPIYTADQFSLLATSSYATAQSSADGKAISALFPWNGKIYIGYGDYDANTGPVHVTYYSPTTQNIIEPTTGFIADTEAIYNYKTFNNRLYGLAIDPRVSYQFFVSGEPWSNSDSTILATAGSDNDPIHIFDMVSLQTSTGMNLWVVGSAQTNINRVNVNQTAAAVWRSNDNGIHWTKVLTEGPLSGTIDAGVDFSRFYFAGVLDNKLYVQAQDYTSGNIHPLRVFDPTTEQWSTSSATILNGSDYSTSYNNTRGWRPFEFTTSTGKKIMVLTGNVRGYTPRKIGNILYFNGNITNKVSQFLEYDITTYNGYVLAITTDSKVMYSSDLVNWTQYATTPTTARSIAADNGVLYIGTADSKIYGLPLLLPEIIHLPSVQDPILQNDTTHPHSSCTDDKPDVTPDLFQITSTKDTATLYFTPLSSHVTSYSIMYGYNEGEERWGTTMDSGGSTGVMKYTIGGLKPNTTYWFKIRPSNGCQSGDWSNSLNVKTGANSVSYKYNLGIKSLSHPATLLQTTHDLSSQSESITLSPTSKPSAISPQEKKQDNSKLPTKPKSCFLWIFCN